MSQSMNRSIRRNPHAQTATIAQARQERDQVGRDWRPHGTAPDGLIEALTALSGRYLALKARNCELADEVYQLHAERRYLRSRLAATSDVEPVPAPRTARVCNFRACEDERRRLQRDLHNGVQNELVAMIVKLRLAEQDPDTLPALARDARCAGCSRRGDARLRARYCPRGLPAAARCVRRPSGAARAGEAASVEVSVEGTAPRSTEEAEAAVYFSCSEALQNVAKHAGRATQLTLRLQHTTARSACASKTTATGSTRRAPPTDDRIQTLGGTLELPCCTGRGTTLTISLPWPTRQPKTAPRRPIPPS